MLDKLTAVRFDRPMSSGKTRPCLITGLKSGSSEDDEIEVIAKFSAGCQERTLGGLVAEAIAAMLAVDLDLPVPEPFLLEFDSDFIDLLPRDQQTVAACMRASAPVAFGSRKLPPGFALWPKDKPIPSSLRLQAAEIFAFDALIQNPDRRPVNPNCLSDGRSFAIFDHELSFTKWLFWQPPWQPGGLELMKNPDRHIFFAQLHGKKPDFSRLEGAWRTISDQRLREYRQTLPSAWAADGGVAEEALNYIAQVREQISPALAEVARILS